MTTLNTSQGLDKIRERYEELLNSKVLTPQKRGFELEVLLRRVLEIEGLEPKSSYRKTGEQMDGSFFWMGQTFLFEAKWEKSKLPASVVYAFKGKVDGKFHTTSGVFIAMNGYGEDTLEALTSGKSGNIILFDGEDMGIVFSGKATFLEIFKYKLRAAGDTGTLFSKYSIVQDAKLKALSQPIKTEFTHSINNGNIGIELALNDLLVFVEGKSDYIVAENLLEKSVGKFSLSFKIVVLEGAYNISQIPSFINAYQGTGQLKGVIVLLDDDMNSKRFNSVIENVSEQLSNAAISINSLFLFLNEKTKLFYSNYDATKQAIPYQEINLKITSFLETTAEDYYDPEEFNLEETLTAIMEDLDWDYVEKCIYYTDDYSHIPGSLNSLDELVEHLNEYLIDSRLSDLPLEWIKEMDSIDYSWDIREVLENNFEKRLAKMGWE